MARVTGRCESWKCHRHKGWGNHVVHTCVHHIGRVVLDCFSALHSQRHRHMHHIRHPAASAAAYLYLAATAEHHELITMNRLISAAQPFPVGKPIAKLTRCVPNNPAGELSATRGAVH